MRFLGVVFLALVNEISAVRILAYFPLEARSHHNVYRPIVRELAARGHQVTYVTPFKEEPHPNMTITQVASYIRKFFDELGENALMTPYPWRTSYDFDKMAIIIGNIMREPLQKVINSDDVYDMVLHGAFLVQEHVLPLTHRFNALGVAIHPIGDISWLNEISGLTDNPSYMIGFQTPLSDRMTFFERVYATVVMMSSVAISYVNLFKMQSAVDECFGWKNSTSRPSLFQLAPDQALILTASHHSVGYAYPKAPHVKEIGGIHLKEPRPLPRELEEFMNSAEHGVIYFSFGSLLRTDLPQLINIKNVFTKVFARLKEKVLLKWNDDKENPLPENILVSKWFPQQDVLAHPKVKLFVTHGGYQSTVETIHSGIPIIAIPFFSDQYKNSKLGEAKGFGLRLDSDNVTEESVTWALNELLNNQKYALEAKRRSALLRDRPMKPLDEAIYWIEYVARHGRVLQPAAVHLSFVEKHLLDVYACVFLVVAAVYLAIGRVARKLFHHSKLSTVGKQKKLN